MRISARLVQEERERAFPAKGTTSAFAPEFKVLQCETASNRDITYVEFGVKVDSEGREPFRRPLHGACAPLRRQPSALAVLGLIVAHTPSVR